MPVRRPRTTLCLVKLEPQSWGPLITVTVVGDTFGAPIERPRQFSNVDQAVAAVAEFLHSFTQADATRDGLQG